MDDPASRVPAQLLGHMHLVSRYRYPVLHMLPTDTAVEYLLSAPKVARELQPMHWTFLDGPPDGSVMLTWQPLNHLGTHFASDGYVWADVEQVFSFEARGYTVEMYLHRSGYHPPNEPAAIHCRRRYRLMPSKTNPNPNLPPPDPSLWIVHYSRAPPTDHIPANRIPILPQVQQMLNQRRFLQSQGQIARKDFMLHDRNSWPTINFPPQVAPQAYAHPSAYAGAIPGRPAYYPQLSQMIPGPAGATPVKAPRTRAPSTAMNAATADFALEDEDVSGGDMMDLLTPREVSKTRYQQHHEWMEEIFVSPYAISQITPVSLGLGRKGELESLTSDFFDAPTGPGANGESKDASDSAEAAKMEPAKAEEFADRVAKKVADMTAEIEKLKKRHARRMERFNRTSAFKDAELKLRDAATDPNDTGSEIWRVEGRIEVPAEEEGAPPAESVDQQKPKYKVDDIIREVESTHHKQITPEPKISCVQKGGLLETIEPQHKTDDMGDLVMDHHDTNLLDQFAQPAQPQVSGQDVEMTAGDSRPTNAITGESGDWVMVNDNNADDANNNNNNNKQGQAVNLPPTVQHDSTGLDTSNFDFTNMDSAGDALAAYTEQNEGLDLPDLETSAFGDAFHASDHGDSGHHHHDDDMS